MPSGYFLFGVEMPEDQVASDCETCGRPVAPGSSPLPVTAYGPGVNETHLYCEFCWRKPTKRESRYTPPLLDAARDAVTASDAGDSDSLANALQTLRAAIAAEEQARLSPLHRCGDRAEEPGTPVCDDCRDDLADIERVRGTK